MDLEWVKIDDYEISKNLITQEQYKSVIGVNPSRRTGNDSWPVDGVNWFKAVDFCVRLSELTGFVIRLPTEDEWENAAFLNIIQRNELYYEWTNRCPRGQPDCLPDFDKVCKGNIIEESYATPPSWEDRGGGYISFRIIKRN
jgi:formylglycine-generating enzyme required for sulfatase activity